MARTLEERRAYEREWRKNNPDKVKAKKKRWEEKNPDKVREQWRAASRRRRQDPEKRKRENERSNARYHSEDAKVRRKDDPNYWKERHQIERERWLAKKIPCACGCGEFVRTPRKIYAGNGHAMRARERSWIIRASISPTLRQIEWAAGFLEGEGSFLGQKHNIHQPLSQIISARQVQKEPLERLQRYFGGSITDHPYGNRKNPKWSHAYDWRISGPRARGVMLTIYSLMSPKRKEQIITALGKIKWAPTPILNPYAS